MSSSKWPKNPTFFSQNSTKMKKIIIKNEQEIMNVLTGGRIVEGRLALVTLAEGTKVVEFKAYNRKPYIRKKDRLICYLEHGWVKESPERIKVFESLPKRLGAARMIVTLERETKEVVNEIVEQEFFGRV